MKFEGMVFTPTGNEPQTIKELLAHYALVVRFILGVSNNKLSIVDNVVSWTIKTPITHGKTNTIGHSLGFIPKSITCSGRVEFMQVATKTSTGFSCIPKLLTVSIIDPLPNVLTNRIKVSETSFFRFGDVVSIGGVSRKITGMDSNTLVLDQTVIYSKEVYMLSLATESVEIFLI